MTILQSLFLFAFFYSSTACFGTEPTEPSAHSAPTGAALVRVSPQLREDLREVAALCRMRFSLNKALLSTSDDAGYRLAVESDMVFYIKANRILQLIHTNPLEIAGSIDKLNKKSIDILYREVSKFVHSRTEQERTERIAYKKLLQERKKERGRGAIMTFSEEILNELPVLRQIKEILGHHASKYEVEMPRFFESDVACTGVNINGAKIISELDTASNSFCLVLGISKSFAKPERSKPFVGLRDRVAFERAHPKLSSAREITLPKTPPSQESKADALLESVKLLCAFKDFLNDRTLKRILKKNETVLAIVEAEDVTEDVLSILLEKMESLSKVVDKINFKDATVGEEVHEYFVGKLETIKLSSEFFTNKISQNIVALKRRKLAPTEEALGVAGVLPSSVASPAPQAEASAARGVEEEVESLLPSASGPEKKERKARGGAKKKKAEEELQPLGSQEKSPVERDADWQTKMCDMVQGLRKSWKSINFQDIQRAVHQLGGTIEPNGKDSHYIIRLAHIETGEPVLGATVKRKVKGGKYPWWLDTAVDALERATGLVTNNMSRVFEKVHSK